MTLDEFIVELEKTPRDWRIGGPWNANARGINRYDPDRWESWACPFEAVAGRRWEEAAVFLGMNEDVATAVMGAADSLRKHDTALRARLLRACGLAEGGEQ